MPKPNPTKMQPKPAANPLKTPSLKGAVLAAIPPPTPPKLRTLKRAVSGKAPATGQKLI